MIRKIKIARFNYMHLRRTNVVKWSILCLTHYYRQQVFNEIICATYLQVTKIITTIIVNYLIHDAMIT